MAEGWGVYCSAHNANGRMCCAEAWPKKKKTTRRLRLSSLRGRLFCSRRSVPWGFLRKERACCYAKAVRVCKAARICPAGWILFDGAVRSGEASALVWAGPSFFVFGGGGRGLLHARLLSQSKGGCQPLIAIVACSAL